MSKELINDQVLCNFFCFRYNQSTNTVKRRKPSLLIVNRKSCQREREKESLVSGSIIAWGGGVVFSVAAVLPDENALRLAVVGHAVGSDLHRLILQVEGVPVGVVLLATQQTQRRHGVGNGAGAVGGLLAVEVHRVGHHVIVRSGVGEDGAHCDADEHGEAEEAGHCVF